MFRKLTLSAAAIAMMIGTAQAQSVTKIELWHGLTGDLGESVNETCARFNASQKEFEVTCTTQGAYETALQNAIAAYRVKKHPTIVQIYDAGTLDLMLSEAYVPAHKLMADNGYKVDWNDYVSSVANYYATSKGELYSFPYNSSTAVFYYNKDAFAKIGKTAGPKTWEEVAENMKLLKAAGYECPMGWATNDSWASMEQFSAIHNQPIATKGNGYFGLDAEVVFNKTKFVDFIKFLKAAYDRGELKIKMPATGADVTQAFASGDCQMVQMSIASHGTVTRTAKPGVNWDVSMLPVFAGTERRNSLVGGASLWVLQGKSADEYKAAAAFLNYIGTKESALWYSTRTGYIPVKKSAYEFMKAQGFYDKAPFKGREVAMESLLATPVNENSRGIRLGNFTQIRKEVSDALSEIFANKATVEVALNAAVERSNTMLRKFERTYAGKALP